LSFVVIYFQGAREKLRPQTRRLWRRAHYSPGEAVEIFTGLGCDVCDGGHSENVMKTGPMDDGHSQTGNVRLPPD